MGRGSVGLRGSGGALIRSASIKASSECVTRHHGDNWGTRLAGGSLRLMGRCTCAVTRRRTPPAGSLQGWAPLPWVLLLLGRSQPRAQCEWRVVRSRCAQTREFERSVPLSPGWAGSLTSGPWLPVKTRKSNGSLSFALRWSRDGSCRSPRARAAADWGSPRGPWGVCGCRSVGKREGGGGGGVGALGSGL